MGQVEKMILYQMVKNKIFSSLLIPRGYAKSLAALYANRELRAIAVTNYILAAVDEEL